jgi:hypothetical protein
MNVKASPTESKPTGDTSKVTIPKGKIRVDKFQTFFFCETIRLKKFELLYCLFLPLLSTTPFTGGTNEFKTDDDDHNTKVAMMEFGATSPKKKPKKRGAPGNNREERNSGTSRHRGRN